MIRHRVDVKLNNNRADTWRIYPIGDIHLGNVGCDLKILKRLITKITDDPLAYWVGMGDYAEYINYFDKRFNPQSFNPDTKVTDLNYIGQKTNRALADIFDPIQSKCVGLIEGNHERRYHQRSGFSFCPTSDLAARLKVKSLGYECMIAFKTQDSGGKGRYGFDAYCHHGFGGGRKVGGTSCVRIRNRARQKR